MGNICCTTHRKNESAEKNKTDKKTIKTKIITASETIRKSFKRQPKKRTAELSKIEESPELLIKNHENVSSEMGAKEICNENENHVVDKKESFQITTVAQIHTHISVDDGTLKETGEEGVLCQENENNIVDDVFEQDHSGICQRLFVIKEEKETHSHDCKEIIDDTLDVAESKIDVSEIPVTYVEPEKLSNDDNIQDESPEKTENVSENGDQVEIDIKKDDLTKIEESEAECIDEIKIIEAATNEIGQELCHDVHDETSPILPTLINGDDDKRKSTLIDSSASYDGGECHTLANESVGHAEFETVNWWR